jgi:hypothetical protein
MNMKNFINNNKHFSLLVVLTVVMVSVAAFSNSPKIAQAPVENVAGVVNSQAATGLSANQVNTNLAKVPFDTPTYQPRNFVQRIAHSIASVFKKTYNFFANTFDVNSESMPANVISNPKGQVGGSQ